MKQNTVVLIEDERPIQRLVQLSLDRKAYNVIVCSTGAEGIRVIASSKPDLVILDLGLTDMDGKQVVSAVREWSSVPVIVCSVRNDDSEILAAFELGASDYITKPFNPDILAARVKANITKAVSDVHGDTVLRNGPITIDLVRHEALLHAGRLALTPKEYELLCFFVRNKGKMLNHRQILNDVWGPAHVDDVQYLRVYVRQLREKIETSGEVVITNEPGIGYRMEICSDESSSV